MPIPNKSVAVKLILIVLLIIPPLQRLSASEAVKAEIWKDPSCGCCQAWADHLKSAGLEISIHETDRINSVKAMSKVPSKLASCHTAKIGGYVIEGHVPASDIMRLLEEKPQIHGLAVPGMPLGSPGMEIPDGEKEVYDVLSFDERGNAAVWSSHND